MLVMQQMQSHFLLGTRYTFELEFSRDHKANTQKIPLNFPNYRPTAASLDYHSLLTWTRDECLNQVKPAGWQNHFTTHF